MCSGPIHELESPNGLIPILPAYNKACLVRVNYRREKMFQSIGEDFSKYLFLRSVELLADNLGGGNGLSPPLGEPGCELVKHPEGKSPRRQEKSACSGDKLGRPEEDR